MKMLKPKGVAEPPPQLAWDRAETQDQVDHL